VLFLLFQLGKDRYALEARRVVEVVPLLTLKRVPQAPTGLVGIFSYRGRPVPAIDLCLLTLGQPANERLSTRIIIIQFPDGQGRHRLLGLVAERATEMIRREPKDFVESGIKIEAAPYLGPLLLDGKGTIQLVHEEHLLSAHVRELVFPEPPQLTHAGD
jgi:chemotaxis-related protein WspB